MCLYAVCSLTKLLYYDLNSQTLGTLCVSVCVRESVLMALGVHDKSAAFKILISWLSTIFYPFFFVVMADTFCLGRFRGTLIRDFVLILVCHTSASAPFFCTVPHIPLSRLEAELLRRQNEFKVIGFSPDVWRKRHNSSHH